MPRKTEPRDDAMLTPKERRFVAAYLEALSVPDAAEQSGHQRKAGRTLVKRPHVRAEIERLTGEIIKKKAVTGERVIAELAKVAFANIDDLFKVRTVLSGPTIRPSPLVLQ